MHDGFILLHRKIRLNWIYKRSDYYHWFTEFIFMANFKDNNNYLFEGEFIKVKRGQFVTSYRQLAKKLPSCSEQKIRTFIKLLIKDKIVLIESLKKATQITICNYDSYQGEQHNSNTVATQQQHNSNTVATSIERKRKKENNVNNDNKKDTYIEIKNIFNSVCVDLPKVHKITNARKKIIDARTKEYDLLTIGDVFKKVANSNFLNGENENGWVASFDWIFKASNFVKILEDNYKNRSNGNSKKEQLNELVDRIRQEHPDI